MFKIKVLSIGLFAAVAVFACAGREGKRKELVIAESRSYEATLFRQNCAICHGAEAHGKQMDGRLIPSLRYGAAAQKTEEEIYLQIRDGKLPMPAFKGQLSEPEIRRLARFIFRDLQGRQPEN